MKPSTFEEHHPDPDAVEGYEGVPRFSKRSYDMAGNVIVGWDRTGHRTEIQVGTPGHVITIYLLHTKSSYEEDWPNERANLEHGRVSGWHFSTEATYGEWGSVPLDQLEPITREEFYAAAERNWRD